MSHKEYPDADAKASAAKIAANEAFAAAVRDYAPDGPCVYLESVQLLTTSTLLRVLPQTELHVVERDLVRHAKIGQRLADTGAAAVQLTNGELSEFLTRCAGADKPIASVWNDSQQGDLSYPRRREWGATPRQNDERRLGKLRRERREIVAAAAALGVRCYGLTLTGRNTVRGRTIDIRRRELVRSFGTHGYSLHLEYRYRLGANHQPMSLFIFVRKRADNNSGADSSDADSVGAASPSTSDAGVGGEVARSQAGARRKERRSPSDWQPRFSEIHSRRLSVRAAARRILAGAQKRP